MVFFLTAAIYAWSRWIVDEEGRSWSGGVTATVLLALAFLAKQVALIALVPIVALIVVRLGMRNLASYRLVLAALLLSLVPLAIYQPYVASHAEWHWASGIMRLHVIPSLAHAFTDGHAFVRKGIDFVKALRMLGTTMLGPVGLVLLVAGFALPLRSRANAVLWGWLAGGIVYAYVVVTVERVDYYWYPLVPLGALVGASAIVWGLERFATSVERQRVAIGVLAIAWLGTLWLDRRLIAPYYVWSKNVYVRSLALDRTLAPGALIVMGHYDPSIMYYIRRKGWMEDPYLWTPFDEESAIRKGARYFIAVEPKRLARNVELSNWLLRFPVLDPAAKWPVYETDPAKMLPGAEAKWQEFRRREKAHLLEPVPQ
jgi:hypothetical protein